MKITLIISFFTILFSTFSTAHANGVKELFNEQKRYYKDENWGRLFFNAQFYRKNYLSNTSQIKNNFSMNLLTIEALALGKHCQWQVMDELLSEIQRLEKINSGKSSKSKELRKELALFKEYTLAKPNKKSDQNKSSNWKLPKKLRWRLPINAMASIDRPENAIIKVKNRCEQ